MNSNKIPRCGHSLLRLVQVNQGPSLSYKETAEGLEIWGAKKIQKSFDETGFVSNLGPLILSIFDKCPDGVINSIKHSQTILPMEKFILLNLFKIQ